MKQIAAYSTPSEANLVVARLKSFGIDAAIRDEHTVTLDWFLSNAIGGVKVEVQDEDFEEAKIILEISPEEHGVISCPHCGSHEIKFRVLSLLGAMFLMLKLPIPLKKASVDCMKCKKVFGVRLNGK